MLVVALAIGPADRPGGAGAVRRDRRNRIVGIAIVVRASTLAEGVDRLAQPRRVAAGQGLAQAVEPLARIGRGAAGRAGIGRGRRRLGYRGACSTGRSARRWTR